MNQINSVSVYLTENGRYVMIHRKHSAKQYRKFSSASLSKLSVACNVAAIHQAGTVIPYSNGWTWVRYSIEGKP